MESNHWLDGLSEQSAQLMRRLNISTGASKSKEPLVATDSPQGSQLQIPELAAATSSSNNAVLVAGPATENSSESQTETPELDAVTPRASASNVVLVPGLIMNVQYSNQSVDVFPPGSSFADRSMSSGDDAFGSGPRTNTFNNGYRADGQTEDRSGGVSPSKPRPESFVAKLGRVQAEERAARGPQGALYFQSRHLSGPADNPVHSLESNRAQIDSPVTPRNPLQETHINPPHAFSRVARSASYLNAYRQPLDQEPAPTRSTYLDQIS